MPPLSLSDIAKSAAPGMGPSYPGESWMHQIGARLAPMAPRLQSQMPILKPKATIDAKMVIKPDERIDYKLIIKRPNVAPPEDKRHHK